MTPRRSLSKGQQWGEFDEARVPQGLKPIHLIGFCWRD